MSTLGFKDYIFNYLNVNTERDKKMDERSHHSTTPVSICQRPLKTTIKVVTGICVASILGILGYLVYQVNENNSTASEASQATMIQSTASSLLPTHASPMITGSTQLSTMKPSTELLSTTSATTGSFSSTTEATAMISSSMPIYTTQATTETFSSSTESTAVVSTRTSVFTAAQTSQGTTSSLIECSDIAPCTSGVYDVFPYGANQSVSVYCECTGGEGMWTVVQKRFDGSVDFDRNWTDYKTGFGDKHGEHWLGLDTLHKIRTQKIIKMTIILTDWNNVTKIAMYETFGMGSEAADYRLNLGAYNGSAGDSLNAHNLCKFSTRDKDNDNSTTLNLAVRFSGPWWYCNGLQSNLNGIYYPSSTNPNMDGILWIQGYGTASLRETTIMIHPVG